MCDTLLKLCRKDPDEIRKKRGYNEWKGNNTILCKGRIIGGPLRNQTSLFWATSLCIIFPAILYFGFVGPSLYIKFDLLYPMILEGIAFIISVYAFLATAFTDPGIIPRGILKNSEIAYSGPQISRSQLCMNGRIIEIKFCRTCKIFRPPRSFHCQICNNCVERFDHHCPWIGNCIGIRNYGYFSLFINGLFFLAAWCLFTCIQLIYLTIKHKVDNNLDTFRVFTKSFLKEPIAYICGVYIFVAMIFVAILAVFHWYLVCVGKTTQESVRHIFPDGSPFTRGLIGNIVEHCCQIPRSSVHIHHIEPDASSNEVILNKQRVVYLSTEQLLSKQITLTNENNENQSWNNNNTSTDTNTNNNDNQDNISKKKKNHIAQTSIQSIPSNTHNSSHNNNNNNNSHDHDVNIARQQGRSIARKDSESRSLSQSQRREDLLPPMNDANSNDFDVNSLNNNSDLRLNDNDSEMTKNENENDNDNENESSSKNRNSKPNLNDSVTS